MERFNILRWLVERFGLPKSWAGPCEHIVMAIFALVIILAASLLAWRKLRHTEGRLVPEERGSLANIFEVVVEGLLRMLEDVMGSAGRRHLPLIAALFVYILVCNLMGVIPGLTPPTDNINTNLACALVVFVYYNVAGIRAQGVKKYLKHMAGPIIWLAPLMFSIELISHLVRPVSLSVRLFGNITGDHMVLGIFSQLTPLLVPVIFQALAIFVAFIQAFVFTLLSVVYITLASGAEER
ncbi:MAG: F0F1 ATP synthase subunit A [Pseudomonadota bacterium]